MYSQSSGVPFAVSNINHYSSIREMDQRCLYLQSILRPSPLPFRHAHYIRLLREVKSFDLSTSMAEVAMLLNSLIGFKL
jgi:hypothetical protein